MKVRYTKIMALSLSFLFLYSCSHSVKKAEFPSDQSPEVTMSALETLKLEAENAHAPVLAPDAWGEANDYLSEAKDELDNESFEREDFDHSVGYAKAYLQRAIEKSRDRRPSVNSIIDARSAALIAGTQEHSSLKEKLEDIDEDLRDFAGTFSSELDPEEFSSFQKRYLALEVEAVKKRELGLAKGLVNRAETKDADTKAPKSFKAAQKAIKIAEGQIEQSPRTPGEYRSAADEATTQALFLSDVMDAIQKRGGEVKEEVAVELVNKNVKLLDQESRIAHLKYNLDNLDSALNYQSDRLSVAQERISSQQAMNEVRRDFSKDEAEVYQQGNQLIIRLKDLDFAVGEYFVPKRSKDLIEKVSNIVSRIDPVQVAVQGHTDSTGPDQVNKALSQKRAKTVATLLEQKGLDGTKITTQGFGPSQPLAANTSKEGRALNRRVDIVVTTQM